MDRQELTADGEDIAFVIIEAVDSNARLQPDISEPIVAPTIARFKQLTEHTLPSLACLQRWPICSDHCFKRICLDAAFGDVWYHHLRRPAEQHLAGEPLRRAIACAEQLASVGLSALLRWNEASLRFRGKLRA